MGIYKDAAGAVLPDSSPSGLPPDGRALVRTWGGGDFIAPTNGGKFPGRPRHLHALISGGSAGAHTATGITVDDDLDEVLHFTSGALTADLTAEFTISDADEIDNTGGTDTSSDQLLVRWTTRGNWDSGGLTFPAGEDTKAVVYLEAPVSWPSVEIHAALFGETFGSGTARLDQGAGGNVFEVPVAGVYMGILDFPTGPTWSPGWGEFSHLQLAQFPLHRLGSHEDDTLEQGLTVVKITVAEGS